MKADPTDERLGVDGAVVVGVDGSDASLAALEWAAEQARVTGRPLVAVTTWEWPSYYGAAIAWPAEIDFARDAATVLDEAIAKVLGPEPSIPVDRRVLHGHAATVLGEASREAGLLVVGSRGHGEFAGMLLGSVSEYLVAHAHCPVVVVHRPEGA